MDQLYNNVSPAFTTWVIENDLFEEPFVVIDVGVQGGPHPCWKHLKDKVRVYGFDAIPEVVEELNAQKQPNEIYFATALGDEEGTRDFHVRSSGSSYYGSSFYEMPSDLEGLGAVHPALLSKIPITRLDTLFAKGVIPPADHIKVDCDGHDPEVIRGAWRTQFGIVAFGLCALLLVEWMLETRLITTANGTYFATADGKMAEAVVRTAYRFAAWFNVTNLNPLQGVEI